MTKYAVGIDEVGRGCWAGPLLVVAARQVTPLPATLNDSKALSKAAREKLYNEILISCDIGEGWVQPAEIDDLGLSKAMKLGVARALKALHADTDEEIIIDGSINYCQTEFINSRAVIKADSVYPTVMAASIYAKVTRDRFMSELPENYAVYEFDRHVGYGTKLHIEKLLLHGVSDLHRLSFKPVKALL